MQDRKNGIFGLESRGGGGKTEADELSRTGVGQIFFSSVELGKTVATTTNWKKNQLQRFTFVTSFCC